MSKARARKKIDVRLSEERKLELIRRPIITEKTTLMGEHNQVAFQVPPLIVPPVRALKELGFHVVATGGTADYLASQGVEVEKVNKVANTWPELQEEVTPVAPPAVENDEARDDGGQSGERIGAGEAGMSRIWVGVVVLISTVAPMALGLEIVPSGGVLSLGPGNEFRGMPGDPAGPEGGGGGGRCVALLVVRGGRGKAARTGRGRPSEGLHIA